MTGHGFIFADYILAILVTFCSLAHLAILRAPDIKESEIVIRVRLIKMAGLLILAIRFWGVLATDGDLLIPTPTLIGLHFFLAAELYRCIYRLHQAAMDEHQVMQSRRDGQRSSI